MTKPIMLDVDDLIRRYSAGESCESLGVVFGVSGTTLRGRLRAQGIEIRQGPAYRTTDAIETLERRAQTRERLRLHAGPLQHELAALLDGHALEYVEQRAIGPFNVDFALVASPLAIDVVNGRGNPETVARHHRRIRFLLDAGWHVTEVVHRTRRTFYPLDRSVASYLEGQAAALSADPSARPKYERLRADGRLLEATPGR